MGKKGMSHRKWTKDQKLEIVKKHLNDHVSVRTLEKEYDADRSMICHWVKKYSEEGEDAFNKKKSGNPYAALHTGKSLSEEERLRLIIAKQEVEIARLKKEYIVKGAGADKEYVIGKEKNMKLLKN